MILGVGCDIIELTRLKKREGQLAKRYLFDEEYKVYLKRINPTEFLAGRLAAKEAVYKALPPGTVEHFSGIEIKNNENKTYYEDKEHYCFISISHDKDYAVAYATCILKQDNQLN